MALYVRQLKLGPMENFVYLVGAEGARETAIVDPAWDVEAAQAAAEADGRSLTHALVISITSTACRRRSPWAASGSSPTAPTCRSSRPSYSAK